MPEIKAKTTDNTPEALSVRHRWQIVHQSAGGSGSCTWRCRFCGVVVVGRSAAGPRNADRETWTVPGKPAEHLAPMQQRPLCQRAPTGKVSKPRATRGGDRSNSLELDQYLADLTVEDLRARDAARPKTRGDCVNGPRPCPWVGCRHHLALMAYKDTVRVSRAFLEDEAAETCSLDVAEKAAVGHDVSLREIAEWMGVAHERVRQITDEGLRALRTAETIDVWQVLQRRMGLQPGADDED